MPSVHDALAVDEFLCQWRLDPHHGKRMRYAYFRNQRSDEEAVNELPAPAREAFRSRFSFSSLTLAERRDSQQDHCTKLVFRTAAGQLLESVILRAATGRTTLCVSSQPGCVVGCAFCATGLMGPRGDLHYTEILDQVLQANRLLRLENRRIRNLVFMGMGEPLLNEANLYRALDCLHAERGLARPPRRTLISTVGIPAALVRCAQRFPHTPLAVSLHSARQDVREQLIPLARRYPLSDLRHAMERTVEAQGRSLLIEYLLLADVNDSQADADELAEYLSGLPIHINLIPYNPLPAAPRLSATPRSQRRAFAHCLRTHGLPVTVRHSMGGDIAAACGQLVQAERAGRV